MLNRRDFFKMAPAATATLAACQTTSQKKTGTCRICTMHCGIIATVDNGRITRIDGDPKGPTQGFLCKHGYAIADIVHSQTRLQKPLRKHGGDFEEVSWDVAFNEIAQRLTEIKKKYGAQALAVQTGWPFVRHPLVFFLHRFCRAFGTPNLATVASLCEASARMGRALVVGSDLRPDLQRCKTILLWGANPVQASPPFAQAIGHKLSKGGKLIVVDPVRTELADHATLHLQVRPGTDGILAASLLHVILTEVLFDKNIVAQATQGFEQLKTLVEGAPPETAANICGVSVKNIFDAAHVLASERPVSSWVGLGVEHHVQGVQTIRLITILEALLGDIGKPGGSQLAHPVTEDFFSTALPQLYRLHTPSPVPPELEVRAIGYNEFPLFEIYNRQAQAMLFKKAILNDSPYPLRAMICFGCNPLLTWPNAYETLNAFKKLELLVNIDPFMTQTGQHADFVLPAATFLESPTVRDSTQSLDASLVHAFDTEVARSSILEPQHQSRTDWQVVKGLAEALDLRDYFPWESLAEALRAPSQSFMVDEQRHFVPSPQPNLPLFPTLSGRIEIVSSLMEKFAVPAFELLPHTLPTTNDFPLFLVTGPRRSTFINSQFHGIASIERQMPKPTVLIHPETAKQFAITKNGRLRITTPNGQMIFWAEVTSRVRTDVLIAPHGWAQANANNLTNYENLDRISGFPNFRGITCRIEAIYET